MAMSLRERRKQLLEDEILDATRGMLALKGYTNMSMDELAAQVGISKPTLYSHFATKDNLIAAAIDREMQRLVALLEDKTEERTPLQRLLLLQQSIIQFHVEEGMTTLRPIMPELKHIICNHDGVLARMQQLQSVVVGLVRAGIAQGEIDPALDPPAVVRVFFALLGALRPPPFTIGESPDISAVVNTITTVFARGVRAQSS